MIADCPGKRAGWTGGNVVPLELKLTSGNREEEETKERERQGEHERLRVIK